MLTDDPWGFRGGLASNSYFAGAQEKKHELTQKEEGAEYFGIVTESSGTQTAGGSVRTIGTVTAKPPRASRAVQTEGDGAHEVPGGCDGAREVPEGRDGAHAKAPATTTTTTTLKPRRPLLAQLSAASTAPSLGATEEPPSPTASSSDEYETFRTTGASIRDDLVKAAMQSLETSGPIPLGDRPRYELLITQVVMRKPTEMGWQEHETYSMEQMIDFMRASRQDSASAITRTTLASRPGSTTSSTSTISTSEELRRAAG